jgi:hypothetical protein
MQFVGSSHPYDRDRQGLGKRSSAEGLRGACAPRDRRAGEEDWFERPRASPSFFFGEQLPQVAAAELSFSSSERRTGVQALSAAIFRGTEMRFAVTMVEAKQR